MARWMLLACTVFGLAAMHTLGHAGMHMDTHPGHGAKPPAVAASMTIVAGTSMSVDDCACAHLLPGGHGPGAMSGWSVCLAVLSGLAVMMLLAALLWTRSRRRGTPATATLVRPMASRAPPRPTGLRLATVSVLRL